jgi:hypothetical protein
MDSICSSRDRNPNSFLVPWIMAGTPLSWISPREPQSTRRKGNSLNSHTNPQWIASTAAKMETLICSQYLGLWQNRPQAEWFHLWACHGLLAPTHTWPLLPFHLPPPLVLTPAARMTVLLSNGVSKYEVPNTPTSSKTKKHKMSQTCRHPLPTVTTNADLPTSHNSSLTQ